MPLDVHLMIEDPDRYLEAFVEAGAAMISVHVEVLPHLHRTIQRIKELGAKAGVALNPSTPVGALEEIAGDVDYVLVMSVNPGFGGQTFIPRSESKIRGGPRAARPRRAAARRSKSTAGSTLERAPRSSRRAPTSSSPAAPSSARRIRSAPRASSAPRPPRVRPREHAASGERSPVVGRRRARPLRRNRQDGRRLLRELLRVVRGRRAPICCGRSGWSYREMEQAGVSLPVIEAHCEYHRPARYDDELEVRTKGGCCRRCGWSSATRSSAATISRWRRRAARFTRRSIRPGKPCRLPDRVQEVFA